MDCKSICACFSLIWPSFSGSASTSSPFCGGSFGLSPSAPFTSPDNFFCGDAPGLGEGEPSGCWPSPSPGEGEGEGDCLPSLDGDGEGEASCSPCDGGCWSSFFSPPLPLSAEGEGDEPG